MAINRYDTPAQAEFINTYVPIPFEQLYTLGRDAKAEVDKAITEQSAALSKWSEFRSPSAVDTAAWNEATLGAVKPVIDKLASNPDLIKTVEGRSMLRSAINNVDTSKLALLQQSRDTLLQRQKVDQELMIKGLYNPEWHNLDYNNYNTLSSGIFNDVSPLAYQSIQDLTDPYYKGIQDSFIGSDGLYDYTGVTREQIAEITDKNLSGIMVTPVAQKHMEVYKKQTGATDEEAKDWLRNKVIQDNLRYVRSNREENQFALLKKKIDATRTDRTDPQAPKKTLISKMKETVMDKPIEIDDNKNIVPYEKSKYRSKAERLKDTINPEKKYWKNYVEKVPTESKSVSEQRLTSARNIISSLSASMGRDNVQYINKAELGDPIASSVTGDELYNARQLSGIMLEDYYMNNMMQVDRGEYKWSSEKEKIANDLLNGRIENTVISPNDAFLPLNETPGEESFMQRGEVYIPVRYLYENFPKFVTNSSTNAEFKYNELWNDKEFKALMKELGGTRVGDDGSLVPRKSIYIDGEKKDVRVETSGGGIFTSGDIAISQSFPDKYVKIRVVRPVADTPAKRDKINILEAASRKTGTTGTEGVVSRSQFENFILD